MELKAENLGQILKNKEFNFYLSNLNQEQYFTVVIDDNNHNNNLKVSKYGENDIVVMQMNKNSVCAFKNLKHFKRQNKDGHSYIIKPMTCIENNGYLHLIQQVKHQRILEDGSYYNLSKSAGTDEFNNLNFQGVYKHLKLDKKMSLEEMVPKLKIFEFSIL